MTKTVNDLKTEESLLKEKLSQLQKDREKLEAEIRAGKNRGILKHKDTLLELIGHGRTSCSDENIANGFYSAEYGPRCTRCALLELDEYNLDVYDIDLSLSFTNPGK